MTDETLLARVDRLESLDEIRQLVAKYSLSLDMRDLDAHVNLFAPDIRVSRDKVGRSHLKRWLDDTLRLQFTGTSHHIGNHVIEFESTPDGHGARQNYCINMYCFAVTASGRKTQRQERQSKMQARRVAALSY